MPKKKPADDQEKKKEPTSLRLPPETLKRINLIAKWKGIKAYQYVEPIIRGPLAKDWADFKREVLEAE